jgi:hypothetical protein
VASFRIRIIPRTSITSSSWWWRSAGVARISRWRRRWIASSATPSGST